MVSVWGDLPPGPGWLCPHGGQARGAPWGPYYRDTNPIVGAPLHDCITPKGPPPTTITLGIRVSTCTLGAGAQRSGHSSLP